MDGDVSGDRDPGAAEAVDRLAIAVLRRLAVAQGRAGVGVQTEPPVRARRPRVLGEARGGVLGPGGIAEKFAADLHLVDGAELAAVGSRSADKAAEFAKRFGFDRAYGSYAELAADPDVDVGLPRCGCPPDDAGRLADLARAHGLAVRGVMGYEGRGVGIPDREKRARLTGEAMERLASLPSSWPPSGPTSSWS